MRLPRLVITGASGFIGRRLLEGLKERFNIVGLARRSQTRCGAPFHENISWFQADVGDSEAITTAFRFVRETGGADYVIHLAAHYDFTGDDHAEYQRTNVDGLRNVLEQCRELDLERFIFVSSLAACEFPAPGSVLTEKSPPNGGHVYAKSKRLGEEMLAEFKDDVPSCIVRLAAIFSDWAEYAPLYVFMETWLSGAWNARVLGGRGESAIPYLHAREMSGFMDRVIRHSNRLGPCEVLIASPNHTVSHLELFAAVNSFAGGGKVAPIRIPAPLAWLGVRVRDSVGKILGSRPFERPWMVDYIDQSLAVDASHTNQLIDWEPRPRLFITRRMAFLVDHRRMDPIEWTLRNRAALKEIHLRPNLQIHRLLEKHQDEIRRRFLDDAGSLSGSDADQPSYRDVGAQVLEWRFTVAFRHILNSIRAKDRGLFLGFCRDFAAKRFRDGIPVSEVVAMLQLFNRASLDVLAGDPEAAALAGPLHEHLSMTIEFGCDQILEIYEDLSGEANDLESSESGKVQP